MKSLLIYLAFMVSFSCLQAQDLAVTDISSQKKDASIPQLPITPTTVINTKKTVLTPAFPGGNLALTHTINNYLEYPEIARENCIEGIVTLELTILPNGHVGDVKVVDPLFQACDQAAIQAVHKLPKWRPAQLSGKPFAQKIRVPIEFSLR